MLLKSGIVDGGKVKVEMLKIFYNGRILQQEPRHLPFTAGTDYHQASDWDKKVAYTYVNATELSVNAILEGIRKGRVTISSGPWISLQGLKKMGRVL